MTVALIVNLPDLFAPAGDFIEWATAQQLPVDVCELVQNIGMRLDRWMECPRRIAGFLWPGIVAPVVVVNGCLPPRRCRSTVAHELSHWICYHETFALFSLVDSDRRTPEEDEADRLAARLLVPDRLLREEIASGRHRTFVSLCRAFDVSKPVMAHRLRALGLVFVRGEGQATPP